MNEDPLSISAPAGLSFSYQNHPLRVEQDTDGEPLFHAGDLCSLLKHTNNRLAVRQYVDEEDVTKRYTLTAGGRQESIFVREPGMWSLILGSHAPGAKPIKRWVTSEVLPAIRKTGQYAMPGSAPTLTDRLRSSRFLLSFDPAGSMLLQEVPDRAVLVDPDNLSKSLLPRMVNASAVHASPLAPIPPMDNAREGVIAYLRGCKYGLPKRSLTHRVWAFRSLTALQREQLIHDLIEDGVLQEVAHQSGTRPSKRLVLTGIRYHG
jgi:prophage antirepressor-like protein